MANEHIFRNNVQITGSLSVSDGISLSGIVDTTTNQTIGGAKSFTLAVTSSNGIMLNNLSKIGVSAPYVGALSIDYTGAEVMAFNMGDSSNMVISTTRDRFFFADDIIAIISGSFSGSFVGDGSGLTGISHPVSTIVNPIDAYFGTQVQPANNEEGFYVESSNNKATGFLVNNTDTVGNAAIAGFRATINGDAFDEGVYLGIQNDSYYAPWLRAHGLITGKNLNIMVGDNTGDIVFSLGNTATNQITEGQQDKVLLLNTDRTIVVPSLTTTLISNETTGQVVTTRNYLESYVTSSIAALTLQQVTTAGNTTTDSITVNDITGSKLNLDDGDGSAYIGINAGKSSTTSVFNTALGTCALQSNTVGSRNVAIGYQAAFLSNNVLGQYNTAVGNRALSLSVDGGYNVAVGHEAGRSTSTTNNTTPNCSIFIGTQTKSSGSSEVNQIVIGHAAIGRGSNTTTLGNVNTTDAYIEGIIHGDGSGLTGLTGVAGIYEIGTALGSIQPVGNNSTVSASYGTVSGGYNNTVSGSCGTISGGSSNTASGASSTIGGGSGNITCAFTGIGSTVGGGCSNLAELCFGTVSGGCQNVACSKYGTVGGGVNNTVSGDYSAVLGGRDNSLAVNDSFIIGSGITAAETSTTYVQNLHITGSTTSHGILQLSRRISTPTAAEGMIISSGSSGSSKLYYYNGTIWNPLF